MWWVLEDIVEIVGLAIFWFLMISFGIIGGAPLGLSDVASDR